LAGDFASRKELARLTAQLKDTSQRLVNQESRTKQHAATLKCKNDDLIRLTKALHLAEAEFGVGNDTGTPSKMRGKNPGPSPSRGPKRGGEVNKEVLHMNV